MSLYWLSDKEIMLRLGTIETFLLSFYTRFWEYGSFNDGIVTPETKASELRQFLIINQIPKGKGLEILSEIEKRMRVEQGLLLISLKKTANATQRIRMDFADLSSTIQRQSFV